MRFLSVLAVAALLAPLPQVTLSAETRGGPRLRPQDGRSTALLDAGARRSETFRQLIARINRSDVIVYVEMAPALRGRFAGTLQWVAATKNFRYVRVSLNPELSEQLQIASLGHELQHAVEVIDAPDVVDTPTLMALYRRIGHQRSMHELRWDTAAANRIGEQVRSELATGVGVSE